MWPLYLVKGRQLSSDGSQYQIKRENYHLRQSGNLWKSQFIKLVVRYGWATQSRRRRHSLMFLSMNDCDSCCQTLTIACFTLAIDVNCDIGLTLQEAQLSLRDRATRACQLKSGKVLHKCRRLVFEKL